jgi:hypothetical protein
MSNKNDGKIWALLVGTFGVIYAMSVYFFIDSIADKIGISSFSEIISAIFVILTMGLISYTYNNPDILFTSRANKERAIIVRNIWLRIRDKRWSPKFGQCIKVDSHTLTKEEHP